MTTLRIHSKVDVKLSVPGHGVFHVESGRLAAMHAAFVNDVNSNRRSLAAILSDAIGMSYFDCDELTLCAVACELGMTTEDMSKAIAYISDEQIVDAFTRWTEDN